MALLPCPECGREISDRAPTCPNCGLPQPFGAAAIEPRSDETPLEAAIRTKRARPRRQSRALEVLFLGAAVIVVGFCAVSTSRYGSAETESDAALRRLQAAEVTPPESTSLHAHRVIADELLNPSTGARTIRLAVDDTTLTRTECVALLDAYAVRAAGGQVGVRKPTASGASFPWCVDNQDGSGPSFNPDEIFAR